ncbi:hypothetical protein F5146DRAFT_1005599 [Armillaria mellea]|nr:hypothetical protein F5146DRAFT_1005599 [Armillaria mellea]
MMVYGPGLRARLGGAVVCSVMERHWHIVGTSDVPENSEPVILDFKHSELTPNPTVKRWDAWSSRKWDFILTCGETNGFSSSAAASKMLGEHWIETMVTAYFISSEAPHPSSRVKEMMGTVNPPEHCHASVFSPIGRNLLLLFHYPSNGDIPIDANCQSEDKISREEDPSAHDIGQSMDNSNFTANYFIVEAQGLINICDDDLTLFNNCTLLLKVTTLGSPSNSDRIPVNTQPKRTENMDGLFS